jgi:type I restriction enzyme R subunit
MEYDEISTLPIQGAFYATASYGKPIFNYFREEEDFDLDSLLASHNEEVEDFILRDNNLSIIKHSPEFLTNKSPHTPTNRISSSLLSRERLLFVLQYGLAYVKKGGLQKHIMRYPQLFATKAIAKKLDEGMTKGIIWHTQGSGKTALAFYNIKHLTHYFQKKSTIPKFYFIVDRLDLLIQAQREFVARGLIVHTVSSKEEFAKDMREQKAIYNERGADEITVVNIHKFKDDSRVISNQNYNTNIQRVFFLDEVHRSYNPKGSFLANLMQSDTNSIKIGLTGTPLLGSDYNSKTLFGDYIHKYYYDASIADGYTLRLIREEIETNYKIVLQEALKNIEVLKGAISKKELYAHEQFVEPMLEYIIDDFKRSRVSFNDETIGGMVICDSSQQALMMYELFESKYGSKSETLFANNSDFSSNMVAEAMPTYKQNKRERVLRAEVILHNVGDTEKRKEWVNEFKAGQIDFLFVYNMLLTGFDAPRLKKLYIGRVIKEHNLLQALTRVNRTYRDFKYGFVVDFADISQEFKATNEAYFRELSQELGDEMEHYSQLFKSQEEIVEELDEIKETLWEFDTENREKFSQQISEITDIKEMQKIKKALESAKSLYNLIRLFEHSELLEKLDFKKLNQLYTEANNRLALLNLKKKSEEQSDSSNLINEALEDIVFLFTKIGQEELLLADRLKETLRKTREGLVDNFDKKDPNYIKLKEELERLFRKKRLQEVSQEELSKNIVVLNKILKQVRELNQQNERLSHRYSGDKKYARVHKRLMERNFLSKRATKIFEALQGIKSVTDDEVFKNSKLLDNESYFERNMLRLIVKELRQKQKIANLDAKSAKYINNLVVKEYINEYNCMNEC